MLPPDLILALRLAVISLLPGAALWAQEPDPGPKRPVDPPVKIAFRLEGERSMVRGTIDSWDRNAVFGSFGSHAWDELDLSSLRRIYQRLMDRRSAEDWILLGELQLRREDEAADRNAETAFQRAAKLSEGTDSLIEAARERVRELERLRAEADRLRAAEQLREGLPEGVAWTAAPWPPPAASPRSSGSTSPRARRSRAAATASPATTRPPSPSRTRSPALPAPSISSTRPTPASPCRRS